MVKTCQLHLLLSVRHDEGQLIHTQTKYLSYHMLLLL